jgi:sugar phosphate isomerase/epimerase
MLSLSTAYTIASCNSWKKLVSATRKLGFSAVELNVEIPLAWMEEIERSVAAREMAISSLHNYCPAIEHLPKGRTIYSGYIMTADSDDELRLSIDLTLRTISWAGRLGAKAVVLHAGEVVTDPSGREFFRYIEQFGRQGKLYGHYLDAVRESRRSRAPKYLERLMRVLDRILPAAQDAGVKLGLENRFYLHEIPSIEEAAMLIERYAGAPLGYWHDTGHAEVFVRQGWVARPADFMEVLGKHLVGMHLHDVKKISDHYAPGSGDLDFAQLAPYVRPETLRVVEAHDKASPEEVRNSISFLHSRGII